MTKINLHGILKYEFGEVIPLNISRPKEVIDAIDSIKKNFRLRITELAKENIHFNIIADGKNLKDYNQLQIKKNFKQIDIVPVVAGGFFWVPFLINLAITVASIAISYAMQPKPQTIKSTAAERSVSSTSNSFLMSSETNLAQQGVPVPVGYGRLRIGGNVILTSMKSYPKIQNASDYLAANKNNIQLSTNSVV